MASYAVPLDMTTGAVVDLASGHDPVVLGVSGVEPARGVKGKARGRREVLEWGGPDLDVTGGAEDVDPVTIRAAREVRTGIGGVDGHEARGMHTIRGRDLFDVAAHAVLLDMAAHAVVALGVGDRAVAPNPIDPVVCGHEATIGGGHGSGHQPLVHLFAVAGPEQESQQQDGQGIEDEWVHGSISSSKLAKALVLTGYRLDPLVSTARLKRALSPTGISAPSTPDRA